MGFFVYMYVEISNSYRKIQESLDKDSGFGADVIISFCKGVQDELPS
jgi:hypothetical protein